MQWPTLFLAAICLDVLYPPSPFVLSSLLPLFLFAFVVYFLRYILRPWSKPLCPHRTEGSVHPRVDKWTNLNPGPNRTGKERLHLIWFALIRLQMQTSFPLFVISSPDHRVDSLSTHPARGRPGQLKNKMYIDVCPPLLLFHGHCHSCLRLPSEVVASRLLLPFHIKASQRSPLPLVVVASLVQTPSPPVPKLPTPHTLHLTPTRLRYPFPVSSSNTHTPFLLLFLHKHTRTHTLAHTSTH